MKRSILSFQIRSCAIMLTVAFAFIAAPAMAAPITMEIRGPGSQLSTMAVSGLKSLSGDNDHHISGVFVNDKLGKFPGALPMSALNLMGSARTPTPAIYWQCRIRLRRRSLRV